MAYYLTEQKRKLLDLFIPELERHTKDFSIQIKNPKLLEKILRNSQGYDEYKWIGAKYIISTKPDRIQFKIKQLDLNYHVVDDTVEEISEANDFFSIFNALLELPVKIKFPEISITEDEFERLKLWGDGNNYIMEYSNNILTAKKNE